MRYSTRVAKVMITKAGWKCERCRHEWIPKRPGFAPAICPKCKSPYWTRPRQTRPAR